MELEKLQKIYSKMLDDKSKEIFREKRLLYSISNDSKYISNMVDSEYIEESRKILNELQQAGKKLIIFGASYYGSSILKCYKDIKWECFLDNYVKAEEVLGLKVIDFNTFENKYLDAAIVLSSPNFYDEMRNQLLSAGVKKENIIILKEYSYFLEQYFEFAPNENKKESFVDAGALNGATSKKFIEWCNGNYSNIWAFEPDASSYEKCKEQLNLPRCEVYNLGLFDKEGVIGFNSGLNGGSGIEMNGETQIKIIRLDDILANEKVTFIKMDIEGVELEALKGAENILRTQKPRLAICVYHKLDDIISIPSLLLEYNPDYEFRLRHYSYETGETVLYAF